MSDWGPLDLLLLAAATWRLSALLVYEDGPFGLFRRLRRWARAGEFSGQGIDAARLSQDEVEQVLRSPEPRAFAGRLLSCLWCTSVWVAAGTMALAALLPAAWIVWTVLALSAGAIAIDRLVDDGE